MRRKKRLSPPLVTLITGLCICLVVAYFRDNMYSVIARMGNVQFVQVLKTDKMLPIVIDDPVTIHQLVYNLKMASNINLDESKLKNTLETYQIHFYSDNNRFNVVLVKTANYGYVIRLNNRSYQSPAFSSLVVGMGGYAHN